jgi:hypothetical protein
MFYLKVEIRYTGGAAADWVPLVCTRKAALDEYTWILGECMVGECMGGERMGGERMGGERMGGECMGGERSGQDKLDPYVICGFLSCAINRQRA